MSMHTQPAIRRLMGAAIAELQKLGYGWLFKDVLPERTKEG